MMVMSAFNWLVQGWRCILGGSGGIIRENKCGRERERERGDITTIFLLAHNTVLFYWLQQTNHNHPMAISTHTHISLSLSLYIYIHTYTNSFVLNVVSHKTAFQKILQRIFLGIRHSKTVTILIFQSK